MDDCFHAFGILEVKTEPSRFHFDNDSDCSTLGAKCCCCKSWKSYWTVFFSPIEVLEMFSDDRCDNVCLSGCDVHFVEKVGHVSETCEKYIIMMYSLGLLIQSSIILG